MQNIAPLAFGEPRISRTEGLNSSVSVIATVCSMATWQRLCLV